jgi:hypothetical protein
VGDVKGCTPPLAQTLSISELMARAKVLGRLDRLVQIKRQIRVPLEQHIRNLRVL